MLWQPVIICNRCNPYTFLRAFIDDMTLKSAIEVTAFEDWTFYEWCASRCIVCVCMNMCTHTRQVYVFLQFSDEPFILLGNLPRPMGIGHTACNISNLKWLEVSTPKQYGIQRWTTIEKHSTQTNVKQVLLYRCVRYFSYEKTGQNCIYGYLSLIVSYKINI